MRPHGSLLTLGVFMASLGCTHPTPSSSPPKIIGHAVRVDTQRRILPWLEGPAYARVAGLAWSALETKFTPQDNGLEVWLGFSRFDPTTYDGIAWPHNPAGLYAMLVDSALLWSAFGGDQAAVDLSRKALDYELAHGTTPASWDWSLCPFASAGAGDVDYDGADDEWCDFCGRGDGIGVIEPDKVGELGFAYLRMFERTGDPSYRDAAVACADALAKHVRPGDEDHSPWPFRVYALTNVAREEYSSNVVGAIELFDELDRLAVGHTREYERARAMAFEWLLRFPMSTDAWSGYFEDIDIHRDPRSNPNQYSALRTARWILNHRAGVAEWRDKVAHLLAWAVQTFGVDTATERGQQWGATVMSEQGADMAKMGSHTARLGATLALWSEATGDAAAAERARRSLNWATYACREDGIVAVGESTEEGFWFSDGYGDYIRHFLVAMGAMPEWAPPGETHLLRSTSVVQQIAYAHDSVRWTTFDASAVDTLRVAGAVLEVSVQGIPLLPRATLNGEGYTQRDLGGGDVLLRVRHDTPGAVVVRWKSGG